MKCPNCGFDAPFEIHYCGKCGAYLKKTCANCEYANPLDYVFCGMCGVALEPNVVKETKMAPLSQQSPPEELPDTPSIATIEAHLVQGERRVATIILADVQGSTDLLEQLGTETWVEVMNGVFQILEAEIYRFGGKVDQFRGDGLVAFFGTASVHEDDSERAVLAALAMQQAAKRYAAELAEHTAIDLHLRVGVNTGEVIVTRVGNRSQYSEDTAMGEAIALAARMETSAEPGTVLVSENTYRLVQGYFEWKALGKIKVKGISQPVAVYRPLMPRTYTDSLHTFGLSVPLIGREKAFAAIKETVAALYDGRGGIMMISGERGIGKSFLLSEVRHHFARQGILLSLVAEESNAVDSQVLPIPLLWLRGRCRSYDQSRPYAMWSDVLYKWLDCNPEASPEMLEHYLRQQLQALWTDADFDAHYPYLANFLCLPLEPHLTHQLAQLDGATWQQHFFQAICAWLESLGQQGPLVISFSDMQWADTASLNLLKSCLPLCDSQSLLWLLVFRPLRKHPIWELRHHIETEYPHRASTLQLPALTKAQCKLLIARLIGANVLSSQTEALILDKAEGNPYFIQELIHTLIVQGHLVQDVQTGQWRATQDVVHLNLPDSLQNLLMARIDRLLPEEKHVLQIAAVIGPIFWSNVLQALVGVDFSLQKHLTALQRAQLIRDRERIPQLGMAYVFRSTLIRDVAYEGLLRPQRATYHEKVARYFSRIIGEDERVVSYNFLAHHYHQAGNLAQEVRYLLKAAEYFRTIYANTEAMSQYNRILNLLDTLEPQTTKIEEQRAYLKQRFKALDGRRDLHFKAGHFGKGWTDATALLPLARQLEDEPVWLIEALLRQPGVSYWRNREEQLNGIILAEEALFLAREAGDQHHEMRALGYIAGQRYHLGDETWEDIGAQALALAQTLGNRSFEVELLLSIGGVYASKDLERSMHYLEMALPITQELNDPQLELDVLGVISAQLEGNVDYYHRLKEYYEKSLQISRKIGNRPAESQALMFCGQVTALYLGDYESGLTMLQQGREIISGTPGETYFVLRIVQIYIEQGRYAEAEAYLTESNAILNQNDTILAQIGAGLVKMILYNNQPGTPNLDKALDIGSTISRLSEEETALSHIFYQQYQMVIACELSLTYLNLAQSSENQGTKSVYLEQAYKTSHIALDHYQSFGFVRPIECTSEKILFYHSKILTVNAHYVEADKYLNQAYSEMMRKHAMLPAQSHFRRTYLQNIQLHRAIRTAYSAIATKPMHHIPGT